MPLWSPCSYSSAVLENIFDFIFLSSHVLKLDTINFYLLNINTVDTKWALSIF